MLIYRPSFLPFLLHNFRTAIRSRHRTTPLIINTPRNTPTLSASLATLKIFKCANPFPHPTDLTIPAFSLGCSNVGIGFHDAFHVYPDGFSLPETVLVTEDIVSELTDADPILRNTLPILCMQCGLGRKSLKRQSYEIRHFSARCFPRRQQTSSV